jgi:hypothetical protein
MWTSAAAANGATARAEASTATATRVRRSIESSFREGFGVRGERQVF